MNKQNSVSFTHLHTHRHTHTHTRAHTHTHTHTNKHTQRSKDLHKVGTIVSRKLHCLLKLEQTTCTFLFVFSVPPYWYILVSQTLCPMSNI